MAPPKQVCELVVKTTTAMYLNQKRINDARNKINSYGAKKAKLKFGIIDSITADVISAIGSLSTSIAEAVVGSLSKIASTFIEAILSQILKIILAFPTSIFSLVAIPHEEAKKAVRDERIYLSRVQSHMNTILQILSKWVVKVSGNEYYKQIKDAMPYLDRAIKLIEEIVSGLEAENSIFNESAYQSVHNNIQKAYEITQPYSLIGDRMQISANLEEGRRAAYQEEKKKIDVVYIEKINGLKGWYIKKVSDISVGPSHTLKEESVKNEYNAQMTRLQAEWKEALGVAELKINVKIQLDESVRMRALGGIAAEFSFDMRALSEAVSGLHTNMKKAYDRYVEYRSLCNTIYNIRGLIKGLISEVVAFMRKTGNAAGSSIIAILKESSTLIEVTYDSFGEVTSRDSKIKMSSKLNLGHAAIGAADASMHASITKSMIDLVNADDVLESGAKEFDEFLSRVYNIPDWDGHVVGIWAIKRSPNISPYIQLIADAFDLIVKAFSDQEAAVQKITDMHNRFRQLMNHNNYVSSVLDSYSPYCTTEAGDLARILSSAGLLQGFSKTLSLVNIIASVASSFANGVDEDWPTLKNCNREYPELFRDQATAEAFSIVGIDVPIHHYSNAFAERIEENRLSEMALKTRIENLNIPNIVDSEKDLIKQPD